MWGAHPYICTRNQNKLKHKAMSTKNIKSAAYSVNYTKANGQQGQIIVKAKSPEQALTNAKFLCFTGSKFNSPTLYTGTYTKPSTQGFAGSHRQ